MGEVLEINPLDLLLSAEDAPGCCGVMVIYDFDEAPQPLEKAQQVVFKQDVTLQERDMHCAFFQINLTARQKKVYGRLINQLGYRSVGHNLNRRTMNDITVYLKKNDQGPRKKAKRRFG